MTAFFAVIAGVLGLAVGSFLNVVIYRVPRGMSLVRPPSRCPSCEAPIRPGDNIPLASYIALRGRCRVCGASISPRYSFVEALTGALSAWAVLRFAAGEAAAFVALAAAVLIALSAIDLDVRRIPNVIVIPATTAAVVWVLAAAAAHNDWGLAVGAVVGGVAAFLLLLAIALVSGGMGFGDVKLGAFVGIVAGRFGAGVATAAILSGFVIGGLVAVSLLATGKRGRRDAIPFGPSLAVGTLIAVFLGRSAVRAWLGF